MLSIPHFHRESCDSECKWSVAATGVEWLLSTSCDECEIPRVVCLGSHTSHLSSPSTPPLSLLGCWLGTYIYSTYICLTYTYDETVPVQAILAIYLFSCLGG